MLELKFVWNLSSFFGFKAEANKVLFLYNLVR